MYIFIHNTYCINKFYLYPYFRLTDHQASSSYSTPSQQHTHEHKHSSFFCCSPLPTQPSLNNTHTHTHTHTHTNTHPSSVALYNLGSYVALSAGRTARESLYQCVCQMYKSRGASCRHRHIEKLFFSISSCHLFVYIFLFIFDGLSPSLHFFISSSYCCCMPRLLNNILHFPFTHSPYFPLSIDLFIHLSIHLSICLSFHLYLILLFLSISLCPLFL